MFQFIIVFLVIIAKNTKWALTHLLNKWVRWMLMEFQKFINILWLICCLLTPYKIKRDVFSAIAIY